MKKLIAGLAVSLFIFGLSGCDGILSSPDDGEGLFSVIEKEKSPDNNRGKLRINNIDPGLYGTYTVYIHYSGSVSNPWYNPSASGFVAIDSSTEVIDLYDGSYYRWTGTGDYYIYLVDGITIVAKTTYRVDFTNGNATINASQLSRVDQGQLTISNIDPSLYGYGNYRVYICNGSNENYPENNYVARSNGYVTIDTTTEVIDLYDGYSRWTGTGWYYVYLVDSSYQIVAKTTNSVSFSNGSATIDASYELGLSTGQGQLTINNIDPSLYGYGNYRVYICNGSNENYPENNYVARSMYVTIDTTTEVIDLYDGYSRWTGTG
ncbi:MAG: hypothetical protein LBS57_11680, partial [Treponema sp.]|nr:hypothetical protein [Treponema sp.]